MTTTINTCRVSLSLYPTYASNSRTL